jgi:tetratricopeptide (TPR) repeat protein
MFKTLLCLFLCFAGVTGCAARLPWTWQSAQKPIPVSKETYRQKAIAFEKQGELRQALFAWRVVAGLDPENESIAEIIQTLERGIANAANTHYQRGVEYYQEGDYDSARQAFLKVIRLSPEHQPALRYLKTRLHTTQHATYRVRRGDSFTKIASDVYKDVSKAYLIAYFNDLDPNRPLLIDTLLVLPELNPGQLLPRRDILAMLDQAQKALARNQHAEVLSITERINAQSPGDVQARRLADTAHFQLAMALMEQKDYPAALERLKQVSPAHAGRNQAIARVRREFQRQAKEEQLRLAQDRLDKRAFAQAIQISEEILALDPSNRTARGIFDAAHYALGKQHLDQGREDLAIDALRVLDKNYQDSAQLLTQAHARLNARAETLYREGVMHFLNEELELAVEAWEKSLALNPDHPKARQDIENARRLLDKWRGLGQDN